jgi:hypothetical protein
MRPAPRAILSGILGFAASLVVGCGGSSGLLSGGQASTLSGQLDRISAAVQQGDCGGASSATAALASAVQGLPATVNTTLRRNLNQGVATVAQLARHDCHTTPATTTTTSSSTSASTSTTTTTATQATTTASTPTQTRTITVPTPTTTPPATTPTPPGTTSTGSGGAGLGGGRGSSSGGAGNGQNSNGKNNGQ